MKWDELVKLIDEYQKTGIVPDQFAYNTPAELTPTIRATLRQLAPNHEPFYLDVTPLPECVQRRCYGNVDRQVIYHGGERIEGWVVYEGWQGKYLALNHHAIWKKPDGTYLDATPNGDDQRILFQPTGGCHWEGYSVPRKYIAIATDQDTIDLLGYHRKCEEFMLDREHGILETIGRPPRTGRNSPCLCGSGKKYKHCCGRSRLYA